MPDWVQVLLANIFQVVEGGLAMLVTGLAGIALHKLAQKFHLQNEAELKQGLDYALNKAIHGAEGWANAKANAPTGNEKMDEAMKIARLLLTNPAFKNLADDQLKKLVEAALSEQLNTPPPELPVVTIPQPDVTAIARAVSREIKAPTA